MADSDYEYDSAGYGDQSDFGYGCHGEYDDDDGEYDDVKEEYYGGSDDVEKEYDMGSVFEEKYNHKESDVGYDFSQSSKGGNSKTSYSDTTPRQSNNHQWTTKNSIVDKQTGSYIRKTVKESSSAGDVFKERSTGRIGYKDEFKTTSTFKVGDKSGYFEHQKEERFRRVDYGKSSSNSSRGKSSYSSNKYLK